MRTMALIAPPHADDGLNSVIAFKKRDRVPGVFLFLLGRLLFLCGQQGWLLRFLAGFLRFGHVICSCLGNAV